jgi:hypothetical protein
MSSPDRPSRARRVLLWTCLLVAFSPVLADLAAHMTKNPWTRYGGVLAVLFARSVALERDALPRRPDGLLWIALGLGVEATGAFLGAIRLGRVGLLLAAWGAARRFGLASPRSLVLLALSIPIPGALVKGLDAALPLDPLALGRSAFAWLGIEAGIDRGPFAPEGVAFGLEVYDSGIPLMPLLAGLSWYRSLRLGRGSGDACLRAVGAAWLAFPAQALCLGAALGAAALAGPGAARAVLSHAAWIAISAFSVARTERWARRDAAALATP